MSETTSTRAGFALFATAIGLVSFGLTMLVFCAAYSSDLRSLVDAPYELWSALCGQPVASSLTLPALALLSFLAVIAGTMLLGIHWVAARKHAH